LSPLCINLLQANTSDAARVYQHVKTVAVLYLDFRRASSEIPFTGGAREVPVGPTK